MDLSRLVATYRTPELAFVGNPDATYLLRIDVWRRKSRSAFYVTIERAFHCELHVSAEREIATESVWAIEETLGLEDMEFDSEESALNNALTVLGQHYVELDQDCGDVG